MGDAGAVQVGDGGEVGEGEHGDDGPVVERVNEEGAVQQQPALLHGRLRHHVRLRGLEGEAEGL